VKIEKAVEVEAGKIYVLEIDQSLTYQRLEEIRKNWQSATGSDCVILQAGLRLVRSGTEDDIREEIAKELENAVIEVAGDSVATMDQAVRIVRGMK